MKRVLAALSLIFALAIYAQAQSDYFPVGPWGVAHPLDTVNVKADWPGERQKLVNLGVTYIESFCEPHDTLWMRNVCDPSNGQIKIGSILI